ncbi:MAG: DUF4143 domain-containing protein [Eubacterium sp.]|nr:DUF4143 domain-containing protein [Eubacterium sp.]
MLRRKYEDEIAKYLDMPDQALLLTGARQTGKTFLIREMSKKTGKKFVEFNLIERPEIVRLFNESKGADDFLMRLSLLAGGEMEQGNTILFFDEIQEAEDPVTLIKFLVDEGSYQYVFSGSLLGVELRDIRSVPVGYLHILEIFPLDFIEFLTAVGVGKKALETVHNAYREKKKVDPFVHEKLLEFFYLYLIIGGMPQAVQRYVDTNNLQNVAAVHHDIVTQYKRDFTKYEKRDKLKLEAIYDAIPSELNKQNKRFIFTYLDKQLKFDRYENSFLWLKDAGVAVPVYNANEPKLPLEQSKSSNLFKLFMNDVGLLNSFYSTEVKLKILHHDSDINNGALFENAAAQQLAANGYPIYYYKSKKYGEIDLLIEKDGKVLPIEVKSGKAYKTHAALNNLMDDSNYHIEETLVLSDSNLSTDGKIVYLPIYMASFIKNEELVNPVVKIDPGVLRD